MSIPHIRRTGEIGWEGSVYQPPDNRFAHCLVSTSFRPVGRRHLEADDSRSVAVSALDQAEKNCGLVDLGHACKPVVYEQDRYAGIVLLLLPVSGPVSPVQRQQLADEGQAMDHLVRYPFRQASTAIALVMKVLPVPDGPNVRTFMWSSMKVYFANLSNKTLSSVR